MNHEWESGTSTNHVEFQREKFTIHFISSTMPLKEPKLCIKPWMLTTCFPLFGLGSNSGLKWILARLSLHFWVSSLIFLFTRFKIANVKHIWYALKLHCCSTALIILSHISFGRRYQLLLLSEVCFVRRPYRQWVQVVRRQCQWYNRQVQFAFCPCHCYVRQVQFVWCSYHCYVCQVQFVCFPCHWHACQVQFICCQYQK